MKAFIRVMKALSDPNRVRVVKLLQAEELCVCEIKEVLGLAQSTVSKHMKILEDAGLLGEKTAGNLGDLQSGRWQRISVCSGNADKIKRLAG